MKLLFSLLTFLISFNSIADSSIQKRLDIGISLHQIRLHEFLDQDLPSFNSLETGGYLGLAIHKKISEQSYIGTKIDIQYLSEHQLNSVRALDYLYQFNPNWRLNGFIGAARYDFRTPAYGYLIGAGLEYKNSTWRNWSIHSELQWFDKLARDKLHPNDPKLNSDSFIDIRALTLGVSYYF